jgi:hypothetical protein
VDIAEQTLLWTKIAAVGQVAGALATAIAVAISLWIVISERAVKMACAVGIRIIIGSLGPSCNIVSFDITNTGHRSFRISSTGWRTGWSIPILNRFNLPWAKYQYAIQLTADDLGSPRLPMDLAPGHRTTIFTDAKRFSDQNAERREDFFCRKLPIIGTLVSAPVYGCVDIPGQKTRFFRTEKSLQRFVCSGVMANDVAEKLNAPTMREI